MRRQYSTTEAMAAVFKHRWPAASVIGLDNSSAMIEKARTSGLSVEWLKADVGSDLSHLGQFDVVVANASLQWLPAHQQLLPRLSQLLKPGGALAVQIPKFLDIPIAQSIAEVTRLPQYAELFAGFESGMHYFGDRLYYDVLSPLSRGVELWVTHYYHVLVDHPAIIEWIRSTGMRPYLDHLPENQREGFITQVLERVKVSYPAQSDGRVLFIFKRLFFITYKE